MVAAMNDTNAGGVRRRSVWIVVPVHAQLKSLVKSGTLHYIVIRNSGQASSTSEIAT